MPSRETAKILADCRDLAIHRLVLSFSSLLDRVGDNLIERATENNPLAPGVIVEAFAGALRGVRAEARIKLAILRELNQSSLSDLNAIYADLNQHLVNLRVVPALIRSAGLPRHAGTRGAR